MGVNDFSLCPEPLAFHTMLEHTFIHIPGIGRKTEKLLWRKGITTWQQFLEKKQPVFSSERDQVVRGFLAASLEHRQDIHFFRKLLPSSETWRLFKAFRDRAIYLDIETNGGAQGIHEITIIGIYDGKKVWTFVNGRNLQEFKSMIAQYDLLITFNGTVFDLPFIHRLFPGISLPPAHIDLRFLLAKMDCRGGLKHIEKKLGIHRDSNIDGLNGYDAVMLWKAYEWGDKASLDRLIQYNTADIVNLEPLMKISYQTMKKKLLNGPQEAFKGSTDRLF